MVHKPKHKVHSFRGLLGDGGQDEINLERSNVNLAYRVVKLGLFPNRPGGTSHVESVVQVFRESQTSIPTANSTVDFSAPDLLAAAYLADDVNNTSGPLEIVVIDFTVLFSRNIFITHTDEAGSASCNYYLEIEEVPVGAATLMQIKLGTARRLIGAKMGA